MLEELEDFRAEIDRVDSEIIKLIGVRMEIARKIARVKARLDLQISNSTREHAVIESWLKRARSNGVPEDLAREIAELLIKYSKSMQRYAYYKPKRVALVGYGKVARSIGELMVKSGHSVIVTGRSLEKAHSLAVELGCMSSGVHEAFESSEYIILAVSREAFDSGYVDEVASGFKGRVVMDVLSSKSGVFEKMTRLSLTHGFSYISTHPLFYPISLPYGEKVVVIPSESGLEVLDEVVGFWQSLGLDVVVSSYEEHERAMAIQQVLSHVILMTLDEARRLLSEKLEVKDVDRFETRNMRRLRQSIETVNSNIDTVLEIQRNNPYAEIARKAVIESLIRVIERIEGER